jgi:hypothetical protein
MSTSYKDEILTYTFLLVFVAGFFPQTQDYIARGFEVMTNAPVWFQTFFAVAVAAAFGFRKVVEIIVSRIPGARR